MVTLILHRTTLRLRYRLATDLTRHGLRCAYPRPRSPHHGLNASWAYPCHADACAPGRRLCLGEATREARYVGAGDQPDRVRPEPLRPTSTRQRGWSVNPDRRIEYGTYGRCCAFLVKCFEMRGKGTAGRRYGTCTAQRHISTHFGQTSHSRARMREGVLSK